MSCTQRHLMFHLKCSGSDDYEDLCGSCLLNNNVRGEPGQDQQDEPYRYDIPELREFVSKRGLKTLHQNIRGLLANKTTICKILDGFKNIHIFSVSETCLSPDNEAEAQIDGYTFIGKSRTSGLGGGVGAYTFLHLFLFKDETDLEHENIECIWSSFYFLQLKVF